MTNHTPGPWLADISPGSYHVVNDRLGEIATVPAVRAAYEEENQANARLIAAAPELLEALHTLIGEAENLAASGDIEGFERYGGRKACVNARAAIAKAEGGVL